MAAINPYLNFNDNCEEAFNFYKSVFGGEYQSMMRFKDMPAEYQMQGENGEKIMHMTLPIGQGSVLMGSDIPQMRGKLVNGDNYTIAIQAESTQEAHRLFDGLSAGGEVTMPLQDAFWGSLFGMFTDKFGIQWMVNHSNNQ
jgi:PhnB protein